MSKTHLAKMQMIEVMAMLLLCVGLARSEPPALSSQYGVPGNFAGPQGNQYQQQQPHQQQQYQQQHQYQQQQPVTNSYGAPLEDGHGHDEHQDYIDSQPKSYEFGYAVKDAVSGNDFGRQETSDGETVRGEYRVQLPDGRTQIVTYTADWRTGFHADVRYEGVAQYPDRYNNGNQGYNNNNKNNNNNNNNKNNGFGTGYDYSGNNNIDGGYHNAPGNNNGGGYNNYQNGISNNNYNPGQSYNYQYGSNSIDGTSYPGNTGSYGGPSVAPSPQPTYGVPFH